MHSFAASVNERISQFSGDSKGGFLYIRAGSNASTRKRAFNQEIDRAAKQLDSSDLAMRSLMACVIILLELLRENSSDAVDLHAVRLTMDACQLGYDSSELHRAAVYLARQMNYHLEHVETR